VVAAAVFGSGSSVGGVVVAMVAMVGVVVSGGGEGQLWR